MTRVAAIIVEGESVALIERRRQGAHYYLFPGGSIEPGESAETALAREVEEELGLCIKIIQLVAEVTYREDLQKYWVAESIGGIFGAGQGNELLLPESSEWGSYRPVWIRVDELARLPVRPRVVAELVARAKDEGWPKETVRIVDAGG